MTFHTAFTTAINQACIVRPCRALRRADIFIAKQAPAPRIFIIFYVLANDLFTESFKRPSYARADGDPADGAVVSAIWGQERPMCVALGRNQECWELLSAFSCHRTRSARLEKDHGKPVRKKIAI